MTEQNRNPNPFIRAAQEAREKNSTNTPTGKPGPVKGDRHVPVGKPNHVPNTIMRKTGRGG